MPITNRDIKRVSRQLFASSRGYTTPFYNRNVSKQEVASLFADRDGLRGGVVLVSAPMGTGKTFFIDQVAANIGLEAKAKALLVGEVTERALGQAKGDVLFVDEADIKTRWGDLKQGISLVGNHLRETQRIGLILGDFSLRNPMLNQLLPKARYLSSFEPLNREFLQGVLRQRIQEFLTKKDEEIIAPELYDVLVPEYTGQVNSFRTILSFLENLVRTIPGDRSRCWLTLAAARGFAESQFDPLFSTDRQSDFLNLFLDYLARYHPRGADLESGFDKGAMILLGKMVGYDSWEELQDEIIDPFGEQGLILSRGVPALDGNGRFARWVEPYFPSLTLMLLASEG